MPSASPSERRELQAGAETRNRRDFWRDAFLAVRAETDRRAAPLSAEDQLVQSMPDASPTKWHRAHTTWFFEQFLLNAFAPGYKPFDDRFAFLFNSYYVAAGPRHARPSRGILTRPTAQDVSAYRAHVDAAVAALIEKADDAAFDRIAPIVEIGLHHEQQHQELVLTDILHAFAQNPVLPAYDPDWTMPKANAGNDYAELPTGIHPVGFDGDGFCFDNELPVHRVLLQPVQISKTLVTNREWFDFIADGGYARPDLWLSDGFAQVEAEGWIAPGYWQQQDGQWFAMTLGGLRKLDPTAPVTQVSYYEADAFARWRGEHLPTEMEWETAARAGLLDDAFGIVWQWTRSSYSPYPGYRAAPGALGEYNGKFMINQMVLRGSSLATPQGHERLSYRNFFHPPARWQFSGLRLARYPD